MEYNFPTSRIRENYMVSTYCDIAMDAYFDVIDLRKKIEKAQYSLGMQTEFERMYHRMIVTVVFSAMCIEAFVNDCAATVFGDEFFYESFDKLSVIGKLQFISKFMFGAEMEKDKAYYSYLKSVFKKRDGFVHSKSKRSEFQGYTWEEVELRRREAADLTEEPTISREEVGSIERDARDAMLAVKTVAEFFDRNDDNIHAIFRLFPCFDTDQKMMRRRKAVLKQLGIKTKWML